MVDVQILYESAPIERSAMLGEEPVLYHSCQTLRRAPARKVIKNAEE